MAIHTFKFYGFLARAAQNLGMLTIAHKLNRSTRTISEHIKKHNKAVERSGFCPSCKRTGSTFFDKKAVRHKP